MPLNLMEPPSCFKCQSREWNDGVNVSETLILFLMPDGTLERTGRKYTEERDMDWQCANGHRARPQTNARLERLLSLAEEKEHGVGGNGQEDTHG